MERCINRKKDRAVEEEWEEGKGDDDNDNDDERKGGAKNLWLEFFVFCLLERTRFFFLRERERKGR